MFLPSENKFGPAKNLPLQLAVRIRIREKQKLSISFDSNAIRENALIIYEGVRSSTGGPMTFRELAVPVIKGNYPVETGRNLTNVLIVNPSSTASMFVFFSGWHKEGRPNPALPWKASSFNHNHFLRNGVPVDDSVANWGRIAFEDSTLGDDDFNDIVAYYTHISE